MARKWNLSCNSFSSSFQLEFWRHGGVWNRGVGRSRSVGTMVWLKFASQDFQCRRINLYPSCYVTLKIERRIGERTKFTWYSRVVEKKPHPRSPAQFSTPSIPRTSCQGKLDSFSQESSSSYSSNIEMAIQVQLTFTGYVEIYMAILSVFNLPVYP